MLRSAIAGLDGKYEVRAGFSEVLHFFVFPPAMGGRSSGSTPLPVFGVTAVLNSGVGMVCTDTSLSNVQHLFPC